MKYMLIHNKKECNNTHYIQFDIITLIDNTYFVRT